MKLYLKVQLEGTIRFCSRLPFQGFKGSFTGLEFGHRQLGLQKYLYLCSVVTAIKLLISVFLLSPMSLQVGSDRNTPLPWTSMVNL